MYGFVLQLARFHLEVLGASSVLLLYHTIIFSGFKFGSILISCTILIWF